MTRKEELIKKLKDLNTDYHCFAVQSLTVCLDGNFSIQELEIILELLKIFKEDKHEKEN